MNNAAPDQQAHFKLKILQLFNQYQVSCTDPEGLLAWVIDLKNQAILDAIDRDPDISTYEDVITTGGIINTHLKAYEANLIDANARWNQNQIIKYRAGLLASAPNQTYYKEVK